MLDDDSVEAVQEVIEKLMAGEVISEPRKTELQEIYEVDDADDGEYLDNHASDEDVYKRQVVFMAVLLVMNVLPMKYVLVIFGVLMFLCVFAFGSQFTRSAHIIGKIDCVLMCFLLVFGNVYLIRTNATLFSITSSNYKIDRIAIAVLKDDAAQTCLLYTSRCV